MKKLLASTALLTLVVFCLLSNPAKCQNAMNNLRLHLQNSTGVSYFAPSGFPGLVTNCWITIKGVLPNADGEINDISIAGHPAYMLGILADINEAPCCVWQVQSGDPLYVYSGGDESLRYRIAQITNDGGLILSDRKDKEAGIYAIDGELWAVDNDGNAFLLTGGS